MAVLCERGEARRLWVTASVPLMGDSHQSFAHPISWCHSLISMAANCSATLTLHTHTHTHRHTHTHTHTHRHTHTRTRTHTHRHAHAHTHLIHTSHIALFCQQYYAHMKVRPKAC